MPDFTARVSLGATIAPWSDPATASKPSRLNPHPGISHSYYRVGGPHLVEVLLTPLELGTEAPADGALGGRLFTWFWAEYVGVSPPSISVAPGLSARAQFTLTTPGGYLLVAQRGSLPPSPFSIPSSKLGIHLRRE